MRYGHRSKIVEIDLRAGLVPAQVVPHATVLARYLIAVINCRAIALPLLPLLVLLALVSNWPGMLKVAAQAPAATLSSGSITGRVVNDSGLPLPNVVVLATPVGESFGGTTRTDNTDENGKFQLSNLPATAYTVRAYLPGFVTPSSNSDNEPEVYHRIGENLSITLIKGGVITGTIQNANGEPMVGVRVAAIRVADQAGRNRASNTIGNYTRFTDDRGIYRIYGLTDGQYVVCAGGSGGVMPMLTSYDQDAPTYHPGVPRSKATVLTLQSGAEVTGIDIRYRGERGYLVTGTISLGPGVKDDLNRSTLIRLINRENSVIEATQYLWGRDTSKNFTFQGIANGDYLLIAERSDNDSKVVSEPRRITIKNGDIVVGDLMLQRLASVRGEVITENNAATKENDLCLKLDLSPQEVVVLARRANATQPLPSLFSEELESSPKFDNKFIIEPLMAGHYFLETRLPGEQWYLKAIKMLAGAPIDQKSPADTAKPSTNPTKPIAHDDKSPNSTLEKQQIIDLNDGLNVGNGVQLRGVMMVVSNGAARLQGSVHFATNSKTEKVASSSIDRPSLPNNLRIYLVPSDPAEANNILRFSEAAVKENGEFSFINLAPGRYWVLARIAEPEQINKSGEVVTLLAWNAALRFKLRQEAERANQSVELKVCQQLMDYSVKYDADKKASQDTKRTKKRD